MNRPASSPSVEIPDRILHQQDETSLLPVGYRMTELGPLPEEWRVVRLGEVVRKSKQIDPRKTPKRVFRYVDVSSIDKERLTITNYKMFTGADAPSRARKLIQAKDVIFATVRPYLKRIALVPVELDGQICSTAFCVLRANPEKITPEFLFFAVTYDRFVHSVSEHQRGSSYPAVTDKDVLNESLPLPPLDEQRAIAHVLRAVQDAREATERVIAALRDLKRSLMRHLFTYGPVPVDEADRVPLQETEIGPLPAHWKVVKLGEVATTTSGGTPSRKNPQNFGGQIPWVKSGELNDAMIITTEETLTEQGLRTSNAKLLPKGTLLVAMYGATAGKVGILGIAATTNQAICAITPKQRGLLHLPFLFYAFIHRREALKAERYGGAQPNLSQTAIREFQFPLPPLDEQREIARILQTVDRKIEAEEQRRQALEVLFKTLLHDLMTAKRRLPTGFVRSFQDTSKMEV